METAPRSRDGSIHVTDERFNSGSHLVGACFALVGCGLLVSQASVQGDAWKIVGMAIFGASLIALFVASTLHHAIDGSPRLNTILRTLDYDAVFLLIAGSATPLVLVSWRTVYGWTVLGAIWAIAVIGIVLRSVWHRVPKRFTSILYIVLGWMVALLMGTAGQIPVGGWVLMITAGLIYSAGFIIYVIEKPNPVPGVFGFHEIWHVLVMGGALTYYLFVYMYVLPA